ncbi:hypothetical protein DY000_02006113 [Brassica cretica]|uniref:DDX21/DDX50 dimerisation domain-containing protein n=1 Tax=Brassica cretica TaxID=69181 RepID=A0ABQ7C002_BRACR|nr:hypothetical protein DY000_02006113 [Brassica cretica]
MLYYSRKSGIEKQAGVKFEHVSAPHPNDIARAVGMEAAEKITQVCDSVVPAFMAAAKELLESSGVSAVSRRESLSEDKVNSIEGLTLTADGQGAVFNVVQSDLDQFIAAGSKNAESLVVAEEAAVDLVVVVMVEARDGENL